MHLRKHIQSQDPLPVQQLLCYLRASPVHLGPWLCVNQGTLVHCQGQQL